MANTYTQIHIQAVFAVQNRLSLIHKSWEDELYMYISGIVKANKHKLLIINGMPDHIHLLFGLRPSQSLSDLMQDVKGSSSKWINKKRFVPGHFSWQEGYGAFSYSKNELNRVINYIKNQKEHHKTQRFINEYKMLLQEFDIDFNDKYIFKPVGIFRT
ncbi:MAG: IS200/IS605 family transposase [Bacteroidales bacterium]|nr:IS200/IS605 family transposase [Bacteroidales bacterium]